jgi:glycosyltransferase involved in cell wall biosynthesis
MRIGFDARPLQNENRYRGIGRYVHCLLEALADVDRDNKYVFYIEEGRPYTHIPYERFRKFEIIRLPGTRFAGTKYVRAVLPQHAKLKQPPGSVDVVFQPDPSLGVPSAVPTVTVFYDLIPLLFAEDRPWPTSPRALKRFLTSSLTQAKYKSFLAAYRRAAAVVAISESSKRDFISYLKPPSDVPVTVTHLASGQAHARSGTAHQPAHFGLTGPFLLYAGGIDTRKNIAGLAHAFYALKPDYPKLQLVMVGKEFALAGHLKSVGWDDSVTKHPDYGDIRLPGFVSDADLASLYKHAAAFVFPSRYEGFGMPVLEAMQAGCPVVAYDNSSIPEVAGDAALLVPDGGPLEPAIRKLLDDKRLRSNLAAKGRLQAAKFTWEATARRTFDAISAAAGKTVE